MKYGPLIYNVETADNQNIQQNLGDGPLQAEWRPDFLGGVMVIKGKWEDGSDDGGGPQLRAHESSGTPAGISFRAGPPGADRVEGVDLKTDSS